jgi:calcineurin-like phosphoesterase family protein
MTLVYIVSDTHFGHNGVCKFLRDNEEKLRPWDNYEEMDEALVDNWNKTVKPTDKVYHLGDVVLNRRALDIVSRLNGDKVLIKGNHDIFRLDEYTKYFRDVRAYQVIDKIILSHIPLHPYSKDRFNANIHGHTHANYVMLDNKIDPWYYNVCVENINYSPILFDQVKENIRLQQENAE